MVLHKWNAASEPQTLALSWQSVHILFSIRTLESTASVLPVQKKSLNTVQHANECKTKSDTIDFTNSITKCIRRRPIQKFLRSRMLTETKIELIYHFKPMFLKYINIFIKGHESDTLNATMQRLCYLPKKFEPSVIRGPSWMHFKKLWGRKWKWL